MKQQTIIKTLILVLAIAFTVTLNAQFAGGEGTEEDPWQIATTEHLNNVRNYLGEQHNDKFFIQTADIDLGVPPWNEDEGWEPIGSSEAQSFRGHYDGAGFAINNLTIDRPGGNNQAFFGYTLSAVIKNIALNNVDITGRTTVSGLVANLREATRIEACYVTGEITGDDMNAGYIGGIVGQMHGETSSLLNCYTSVNVKMFSQPFGMVPHPLAAGLAGIHIDGDISNCYAAGSVYYDGQSQRVAALIGQSREEERLSGIYWNNEMAGQTHGVGQSHLFPGNSTAELIQQVTYEGFDFNEVWRIEEGFSYPWLLWQQEPGQHNIPGPRNLEPSPGDETVLLTWQSPVMEQPPLGYNIYRDNQVINEELVTELQYQDTELNNWRFYEYYVTAVYEAGESMASNTVRSSPVSFAGGAGTEDDPYLVETVDQLHDIRFAPAASFRQIADIDLDVEPYNQNEGWPPVGSSDEPFEGSYNGDFYRITNLMIDRDSARQGLFGHVEGTVIKNISLHNVSIKGADTVGGLTGYSEDSEIYRCSVAGHVRGTHTVGGLIGESRGDTNVVQCCTSGLVAASGITQTRAGGIIGYQIGDSRISDSYSTAEVSGYQRRIGGLVGHNWNESGIIRSFAAGWIDVTYPVDNVGGIVGQNWDAEEIVTCYWNIESTGQDMSDGGTGLTTTQMMMRENFEQWDFDNIWDIDENTTYPYLRWSEEAPGHNYPAPYNLTAETDFVEQRITLSWNMRHNPVSYNIYRDDLPVDSVDHPTTVWTDTNPEMFTEHTYRVTAVFERDDEMLQTSYSNNISAVIVDPFEGGDGTEDNPYQVANSNQLNNVRYLLDSHFIQTAPIDLDINPWNEGEGWVPIGTNEIGKRFTGSYNGDGYTISNLFIDRNSYYQGLFAYIEDALLENIVLENVDIAGDAHTGSLTGYQHSSKIINCSARGNIVGETAYTGGLVGHSRHGDEQSNVIIGSYAVVNVSGVNYAGGLVGHIWNGLIARCRADGNVTGNNYTGGLIGWNRTGVHDSFATGQVNGALHVGGLAGRNSGTVRRCYSTGLTNGNQNVGGLIGSNTGNVDNSYWNMETSNQEFSAGGTGRLTRQMTYPPDECFINWDFDEIWDHDYNHTINDGYPILRDHFYRLDTPRVTIRVIVVDEVTHALLNWEAIEDASVYRIYASDDPQTENWGEPVAVIEEIEFREPVDLQKRFYRVVAASN